MNTIPKVLVVITVILFLTFARANEVSIIPQPAEMEILDGHFVVASLLTYRFAGKCNREASNLGEMLRKEFNVKTAWLKSYIVQDIYFVNRGRSNLDKFWNCSF